MLLTTRVYTFLNDTRQFLQARQISQINAAGSLKARSQSEVHRRRRFIVSELLFYWLLF